VGNGPGKSPGQGPASEWVAQIGVSNHRKKESNQKSWNHAHRKWRVQLIWKYQGRYWCQCPILLSNQAKKVRTRSKESTHKKRHTHTPIVFMEHIFHRLRVYLAARPPLVLCTLIKANCEGLVCMRFTHHTVCWVLAQIWTARSYILVRAHINEIKYDTQHIDITHKRCTRTHTITRFLILSSSCPFVLGIVAPSSVVGLWYYWSALYSSSPEVLIPCVFLPSCGTLSVSLVGWSPHYWSSHWFSNKQHYLSGLLLSGLNSVQQGKQTYSRPAHGK